MSSSALQYVSALEVGLANLLDDIIGKVVSDVCSFLCEVVLKVSLLVTKMGNFVLIEVQFFGESLARLLKSIDFAFESGIVDIG